MVPQKRRDELASQGNAPLSWPEQTAGAGCLSRVQRDGQTGGASALGLLGVAVAGLALLVVLYVLSIGPAIWFAQTVGPGPSTMNALEVVYSPLRWAYDNTPLHGPLEWYVEIWGG